MLRTKERDLPFLFVCDQRPLVLFFLRSRERPITASLLPKSQVLAREQHFIHCRRGYTELLLMYGSSPFTREAIFTPSQVRIKLPYLPFPPSIVSELLVSRLSSVLASPRKYLSPRLFSCDLPVAQSQILVDVPERPVDVPQRLLLPHYPPAPSSVNPLRSSSSIAAAAAPPAAEAMLLPPEPHLVQQRVHVLPVSLGPDVSGIRNRHVREHRAQYRKRQVHAERRRGSPPFLSRQERVRHQGGGRVSEYRGETDRSSTRRGGEYLGGDQPRQRAVREGVPGHDAGASDQRESLLRLGVPSVHVSGILVQERIFETGREGDGEEKERHGDQDHAPEEEVSTSQGVHLPNDEGRNDEFDRPKYNRGRQQRLGIVLGGGAVKQLGKDFRCEVQYVDVSAKLLRDGKEGGDDGLAPVVRQRRMLPWNHGVGVDHGIDGIR
mmetsp:Transcript_25695/g.47901  ORF Transcript_25695/g.47901 Transcript_25695/m.47901 type:complete len:437 (+) Transcript_25695:124-1434(+)